MEILCKFEFHTVKTDELISIYCFKGAEEYPRYSMSKKGRDQEGVDSVPLATCGSCLVRNCAFIVPVSLVLCFSKV